jgi:hypothetical protein
MHGQFYRHLQRPSVDKEKSLAWLHGTGLRGETESLIIATQDQAFGTHYNQWNSIKQPADSSQLPIKFEFCYNNEHDSSHIKQSLHPLYQSRAVLTMLNYGIRGKFKLTYLY